MGSGEWERVLQISKIMKEEKSNDVGRKRSDRIYTFFKNVIE